MPRFASCLLLLLLVGGAAARRDPDMTEDEEAVTKLHLPAHLPSVGKPGSMLTPQEKQTETEALEASVLGARPRQRARPPIILAVKRAPPAQFFAPPPSYPPTTAADITHLAIEKAALARAPHRLHLTGLSPHLLMIILTFVPQQRCNYEAGDRIRSVKPLYLEERYQEDAVLQPALVDRAPHDPGEEFVTSTGCGALCGACAW